MPKTISSQVFKICVYAYKNGGDKNMLYICENGTWSTVYINGESTNYVVSTDGRLYNTKTGKLKSMKTVSTNGYVKAYMYHNGRDYHTHIHRIVAKAFVPNPDNKPEVNHINGNKLDNNFKNLEWVTGSENIRHAFKTGLIKNIKRGSDSNFAKYTEDQIHLVCKLLQSNRHTIKEISEITGVSTTSVKCILNSDTWCSISKNYDFSEFIKNNIRFYSDDKIKLVCELLESNKYYFDEISDIAKINIDTVKEILHGKSHTDISKYYDFGDFNKFRNKKFSKNQENLIYTMICNGYDNHEILTKLSLDYTRKNLDSIRHFRNKIKTHKF